MYNKDGNMLYNTMREKLYMASKSAACRSRQCPWVCRWSTSKG